MTASRSSPLRRLQTERVAQGRAGILGPEQATTLQFRDDEVDEVVERIRIGGAHQVEAVAGARGEPFLDAVGDGFGGADHGRVTTTRGEVAEQLAQGGTTGLDDALHRRIATLRTAELLDGRQVGDGGVEVVTGVVLTREHAEL